MAMNNVETVSTWSQYTDAATVLGGFATAIGILIATISLIVFFLQSNYGATVSREINAFQAHKEYLQLCMEYPELSSSTMMLRHLGRANFSGILTDLTEESEKSLWFFSYILFAMEQMALNNRWIFRADPAWRRRVEDQLSYHVELLAEVWPSWRTHYSKQLDELVVSALAAGPGEPAQPPDSPSPSSPPPPGPASAAGP
jgi:hypothetical protein